MTSSGTTFTPSFVKNVSWFKTADTQRQYCATKIPVHFVKRGKLVKIEIVPVALHHALKMHRDRGGNDPPILEVDARLG